jgi:hypothetical protein
MKSVWPIALFARPRATSTSTSSSRGVRPSRAAGESSAAAAGAAALGQQLGERVARAFGQLVQAVRADAARERPQRGDQRRIRDLRAAELEALAEEDARAARVRARLDLAQQPRLADARLAAGEHERRAALRGPFQRAVEQLQLGRPADERG